MVLVCLRELKMDLMVFVKAVGVFHLLGLYAALPSMSRVDSAARAKLSAISASSRLRRAWWTFSSWSLRERDRETKESVERDSVCLSNSVLHHLWPLFICSYLPPPLAVWPPTPRPVNQSETCLSSPLTPTHNSHILPVLSTKHTHKPAHAQTHISNKRHLSFF